MVSTDVYAKSGLWKFLLISNKFVNVDAAVVCSLPDFFSKYNFHLSSGNIVNIRDGVSFPDDRMFILQKRLWAMKFSELRNRSMNCRSAVRLITFTRSQRWYWIIFSHHCDTLIICVQKLIYKVLIAKKIFFQGSQAVLLVNFSYFSFNRLSVNKSNKKLKNYLTDAWSLKGL